MGSNLSVTSFYGYIFEFYLGNSSLPWCYKDTLLYFILKVSGFCLSHLCLICLEVILIYGMMVEILFHRSMWISTFAPVFDEFYLLRLPMMVRTAWAREQVLYVGGFLSGFFILFHCSVFVFLYQHHIVLITTSITIIFIGGRGNPSKFFRRRSWQLLAFCTSI